VWRVLLGLVGMIGVFVSMGLAVLFCIVSQEKPSTKFEWGVVCGVIFVASVMCLLFAARRAKQQR
jgi:hypothetical protein